MLVGAITAGDLGGPLFWPLFVIILFVVGVISAVALSAITALADLVRSRWHFPIWVPPLVVFSSILLPYSIRATPTAIANGVLLGLVASIVFALYWLAVSSTWFLPRLLARLFHIQFPSHDAPKIRNA